MSTPIPAASWRERASSRSFPHQAFIDGRYVPAESEETFDCITPIDGRVLTKVASCRTEDVDRAVQAGRRAFESDPWGKMAPAERKTILLRLAELLLEHKEELALLESLDMGKPIRYALSVDVPGAARCIQWCAEAIDKLYDEIAPTSPSALALVTRKPLGVVGAVIPWNFPLYMAAWKAKPALAAGNCVIWVNCFDEGDITVPFGGFKLIGFRA